MMEEKKEILHETEDGGFEFESEFRKKLKKRNEDLLLGVLMGLFIGLTLSILYDIITDLTKISLTYKTVIFFIFLGLAFFLFKSMIKGSISINLPDKDQIIVKKNVNGKKK